MKHVTVADLYEIFDNLKSCTAVSIQTETIPAFLKTNRGTGESFPYGKGEISKVGIMSGLIGCSYANAVNNQLGREDKELDFTPQPRTWGRLMVNKVMVYHVNKQKQENFYLQMHVTAAQKSIYLDGDKEVSVDELQGWLPKKDAPSTQNDLEKKIILRDINLENIKRIKINGELLVIEGTGNLPTVEAVTSQTKEYVKPKRQVLKESAEDKRLRLLNGKNSTVNDLFNETEA